MVAIGSAKFFRTFEQLLPLALVLKIEIFRTIEQFL
jgi:hypothetical protein